MPWEKSESRDHGILVWGRKTQFVPDYLTFYLYRWFSISFTVNTEKVYSGVEIVPAWRLKVPGQGVHICTMPLYTKTSLHSGNNIGIMFGVFKKKNVAELSP